MSSRVNSSLRDAGKLYLLYMAAGIAAIPAGIAYSLVHVAGMERWWTISPLLIVGFSSAIFAWRYCERSLLLIERNVDRQPPHYVFQPTSMPHNAISPLWLVLAPKRAPSAYAIAAQTASSLKSREFRIFLTGLGHHEHVLPTATQFSKVMVSKGSENILKSEGGRTVSGDRLRALLAGTKPRLGTISHDALIAQQLGGS